MVRIASLSSVRGNAPKGPISSQLGVILLACGLHNSNGLARFIKLFDNSVSDFYQFKILKPDSL